MFKKDSLVLSDKRMASDLELLTSKFALKKGLISGRTYSHRILFVGTGRYLRGHPAHLIQQANHAGNDLGIIMWAPVSGEGVVDVLPSQDYLYTIALRGTLDGKKVYKNVVIDNITGVIGHEDLRVYLNTAINPNINVIVSQTTEKGIPVKDIEDGTLPSIDKRTPDAVQKTTPGKLAQWLIERYSGGYNGRNVIIPTELIYQQGDHLAKGIEQLLRSWGKKDIADIVKENVIIANTLPDRICTGKPENLEEFSQRLGYLDKLPNIVEPYSEFVIEDPTSKIRDIFPIGSAQGVSFVDDVTPYFKRKLHLLNGSHTSLTPIGLGMGYTTVLDAVNDPLIERFVVALQSEVIDVFEGFSKDSLRDYAKEVISRFKNPYIRHKLEDIAVNQEIKMSIRIMPIVASHSSRGCNPRHLAFAIAAGLYHLTREETNSQQFSDSNQYIPYVRKLMDNLHLLRDCISNDFIELVAKNYETILNQEMKRALELHVNKTYCNNNFTLRK